MTLTDQQLVEELTDRAGINLRRIWRGQVLAILIVPLAFNWLLKVQSLRSLSISEIAWIFLWATPFVVIPYAYYFYRLSKPGIKVWIDKNCPYPRLAFLRLPFFGMLPVSEGGIPPMTPFEPHALSEISAWLASLQKVQRQKLQILWLPSVFLSGFSVAGGFGLIFAMSGVSHHLQIFLEIALIPLVLLTFPRVRHYQKIIESLQDQERSL